MGSISLLGTRTPQLVCLFAKEQLRPPAHLRAAVAAAADKSQSQKRVESEISKLDTTKDTTLEDVEQSVRQPLSRGAVCLGKPELRGQSLPTPECPRAVQAGAGGPDLLPHHRRPREHLLRPRDSADLPVHRDLRGLQQCLPSSWWLDTTPRSRRFAVPASRERSDHVPGHLQRAVRLQRGSRPRRRSGVQGGSQPAALPPRAAHCPQDQPAAACRPAAWQGWQLDRLGGGEAGRGHRDGGEKAGELIEYVTDAAEKRLSKSDEDAKVGALTKNSVKVAVTATDATVKVSGYVADRVGNLTKRMASYLAAKVVDPNKPGGIKKGGSAMGTIVDAARGGLVAYGTVYNGLEANAKVLGNNLKQNSVKVVQHKYGNQAGDEFGKVCTAAGNAAMTYMNIQSLGAKGLVKKTAKNTGKNIAKNIVGMGSEEKKAVTQAEVKQ